MRAISLRSRVGVVFAVLGGTGTYAGATGQATMTDTATETDMVIRPGSLTASALETERPSNLELLGHRS